MAMPLSSSSIIFFASFHRANATRWGECCTHCGTLVKHDLQFPMCLRPLKISWYLLNRSFSDGHFHHLVQAVTFLLILTSCNFSPVSTHSRGLHYQSVGPLWNLGFVWSLWTWLPGRILQWASWFMLHKAYIWLMSLLEGLPLVWWLTDHPGPLHCM